MVKKKEYRKKNIIKKNKNKEKQKKKNLEEEN